MAPMIVIILLYLITHMNSNMSILLTRFHRAHFSTKFNFLTYADYTTLYSNFDTIIGSSKEVEINKELGYGGGGEISKVRSQWRHSLKNQRG